MLYNCFYPKQVSQGRRKTSIDFQQKPLIFLIVSLSYLDLLLYCIYIALVTRAQFIRVLLLNRFLFGVSYRCGVELRLWKEIELHRSSSSSTNFSRITPSQSINSSEGPLSRRMSFVNNINHINNNCVQNKRSR